MGCDMSACVDALHRVRGMLCGVIIVSMAAGPVWAGPCDVPPVLLRLTRVLAPIAGGEDLSPGQVVALTELLKDLSERRLVRELEENGLESLTPTALAIVTDAQRLSLGERDVKAWHLRKVLRELEEESVIACREATGTDYQAAQQERKGGFVEKKVDEKVDWSKVEKTLETSPSLSLGLLIGAVVATVGLLFGLDFTVRWTMAVVYNRKACRIPATLSVKHGEVTGAVVTLGRGGFRFQPDMATDLDLKLGDQDAPLAALQVEDLVLPATLSANHGEVADFRFDEHLSVRTQRTMLRLSKISPYTIRKSRGPAHAPVEILKDVDFDAEPVELDTTTDKPETPPAE